MSQVTYCSISVPHLNGCLTELTGLCLDVTSVQIAQWPSCHSPVPWLVYMHLYASAFVLNLQSPPN